MNGLVWRRRRYDVTFYTPWVGSLVSPRASMPTGGAETQVLFLAKALAARGAKVAIIAFGRPGELPDEVEGVSIVPRPPYERPGRFVGKLVEGFLIWRSLWRAPSRTIIVRGCGIQLGIVGLFARFTGRRFIYSSANVVDFSPGQLLPKLRDRFLHELGVRLAHGVVVQTEEQVEMCCSAYRRTPVLIKSIEPLSEPQTRTPEAFVWVGRLVSYKCPLEYVELARAVPEARFWMVGVPMPHNESDRQVAEAVSAEAAKVPNLELLPPRRQNEMAELMSRAVASVNTAEFEGMPNVLLEAWSCGVPALVLTHDPGGVVAAYGLGGYAHGSRERLVSLARELWSSRQRRSELAERCREYIATHHSPDRIASEWLAVLGIAVVPAASMKPDQTVLRCAG